MTGIIMGGGGAAGEYQGHENQVGKDKTKSR